LLLRNDLFSMEWLHPAETPGSYGTPTIGHHMLRLAPL
jgi:hypothetical protein